MATDLTEFEQAVGGVAQRVCRMKTIVDELTEERRAKLLAALVTRTLTSVSRRYRFSAERISGVLASWQVRISPSAIDKHRRGGCGCPPLI